MTIFYTNPRLTALAVLFVLLLGGTAFMGLARQEDPTMTERWATVTTFLPGATASRVESLVSEPLETGLREIPEIRTLSSNSRAGYSLLDVELYDHVDADDTDVVWSEIRDKLAEIRNDLPTQATAPTLEINAPIAATLVLALSWDQPGPEELSILSRLARTLEVQLANLPGTRETEVFGEAREEIVVSLDPYRLAAAGLSAGEVSRIIAATDTKTSGGRLNDLASDLLVEVDAELDSPERIARIPLRRNPAGHLLRVSDLAEVRKAAMDPPATLAYHGPDRALFVMAKMETDQKIDRWIDQALAEVDAFERTLPHGVGLQVVFNQNDYTGARMRELSSNLVWALAIVMGGLVWFMGVRSALTVGVALPLSGAMVLGIMNLMNVPLHQMSVTGLIISLGLLIDNAIVVAEEYKSNRRRGDNIERAIGRALRHLMVPLGASTATTVFAFLTIAMAPGGVGDFTGTIGLSVVLAVTSSYLLAMTVVPAVAGFLEQRWPPRDGRSWWQNGYASPSLTTWYRRALRRVITRRYLALAIGSALPVTGFLLAPTLTQQFFPPVDRNQFQVQLSLPAHASIWETRRAMAVADGILRSHPDVLDTYWSVGEGGPRTYYNVMSLNDGVASFAGAWVDTRSAAANREMLPELQTRLSTALPEAQVLALPFEQGPPFEAPIELRVIGPDLDRLRQISDELRRLLTGLEHVTYTRAGVSAATPKLVFLPDENAAAAAGLRTGELPGRLNDALVGATAGSVQEGSTEIPVRVRLGDARRDDMQDLSAMPLAGNSGGTVPLDQLGAWHLEPAPSGIQRYQGERVSKVQAYLQPYVLPAAVMAAFRERLEDSGLELPPGYRLDVGGEEEERSESMSNLLSVFSLFAAAMAGVVILSLNSFRQAAIIGLVAVLSFGLALFGVRLFGYPFGFQALIGELGMVGLAINGAIIVISALKADPGASAGDPEAAVEVVVGATRHILSTTATTMGGFVPLILFGGTFWPPLATAIAGGVGGSALLALFTVPALYLAIASRAAARHDKAAAEAPARLPDQPALSPVRPRKLAS